jgi:hypothetical protein
VASKLAVAFHAQVVLANVRSFAKAQRGELPRS